MDCKTSSTQTYSFGTISVSVEASGIDKANELCDYVMASTAAIGEIEALRKFSEAKTDGDGTKQTCTNDFSFGEISVKLMIDFELSAEVSNRNLNDIVAEIMQLFWASAGNMLGNNRGLGQKPHKAVLADIDKVLGLTTSSQSANGQRSTARQPNGGGRSSSRQSRSRASSRH